MAKVAFSLLLQTGASDKQVKARLKRLLDAGKISENTHDQRLGYAQPERRAGQVLWLHAAHASNVQPCISLVEKITEDRPEIQVILTTNFDPTSLQELNEPALDVIQIPDENLGAIRRFLTHWSPACLIWVGGVFSPAILAEVSRKKIPSLTVDTAHSTLSITKGLAVPGLKRATLRVFNHVFSASKRHTQIWWRAGVPSDQIHELGPLVDGFRRSDKIDEIALSQLVSQLKTRPSWLARDVTFDELSDVIQAHKYSIRRAHRLLLILHMAQEQQIERALSQLKSDGLFAQRYHEDTPISEALQVLILPEKNPSSFWYRVAPVSFLGHSLSDAGGIDPFPAAAMGSAITHGPFVTNFKYAYTKLDTAQAAEIVRSGRELGQKLERLLSPDAAANLAHAAWEVGSSGAQIIDSISDLVHDILDQNERTSQ